MISKTISDYPHDQRNLRSLVENWILEVKELCIQSI